jgi:hypothetical protein
LYVADPGSGAIYRYALADGLPQTSPDEVFAKVPGVDYLGVDGAGHIYAAGSENSSGFVQKFSAGGALLGKIAIDISVGSFAVDNDGFMYVAPDIYGNQAFTYSPKSFKSSGHAKPIATLTAEGGSTGPSEFISIAADDKGRLYDAAYFGLNVFDHPRRTSSQSATIGVPKGGWVLGLAAPLLLTKAIASMRISAIKIIAKAEGAATIIGISPTSTRSRVVSARVARIDGFMPGSAPATTRPTVLVDS